MIELIQLLAAILVLFLGVPIGDFLASKTKEELSQAQKWIKLIIGICFVIAIFAFIYRNDALLFSVLFIAIVASRSLNSK